MTPNRSLIEWRRSTYSAQGANCVEVASSEETRAVRDSKDPDGPLLTLSRTAWAGLLHSVKTGAHDLR
ncbi:DUF397 domain-containing protein [Actinomadura chokoriensis]|uniref:DUF397 domain-containing protein n=1 Tax=Actinomadura chokoriensis TaxID=454156 RepID=A0ABV4QRI5_9ACTN